MQTYGQDTEFEILTTAVRSGLFRGAVDVGAATGETVEILRPVGCVWAIEPVEPNFERLRERFGTSEAVRLFNIALSSADSSGTLYLAEHRNGAVHEYFHSLHRLHDTPDAKFRKSVAVPVRRLSSLISETAAKLPYPAILKVDTEGNDLEVLRGAADVLGERFPLVLAEYWLEPNPLGPMPFTLDQMCGFMKQHGYVVSLFICRAEEQEHIQFTPEAVREGRWGNAVFIHNVLLQKHIDLVSRILSVCAERAEMTNSATVSMYRQAANERLELIGLLQQVAEERLNVIQRLHNDAQLVQGPTITPAGS